MCYSPLCYSRETSIRSHWRRRDVVCAYAVKFWMVGDGGQRPFVYSGRHSHHCQRLLRKELVVAATYLMRPVEAEYPWELTRLFCSPPREDPTTGKRLTRVGSRWVIVACVVFQESVTTPTPEQRGGLWACARSFDSLSKSVSGKGGVFVTKQSGRQKSKKSRRMTVWRCVRPLGRMACVRESCTGGAGWSACCSWTARPATWEPEGARTVARRNVAA